METLTPGAKYLAKSYKAMFIVGCVQKNGKVVTEREMETRVTGVHSYKEVKFPSVSAFLDHASKVDSSYRF